MNQLIYLINNSNNCVLIVKVEEATSDVIMVMRTTLSKKEFAAALGMKENDLFVQKMFNIVDKDGDNRISFQVRMVQYQIT